MAENIVMPRLGNAMIEGKISKWRSKEGNILTKEISSLKLRRTRSIMNLKLLRLESSSKSWLKKEMQHLSITPLELS